MIDPRVDLAELTGSPGFASVDSIGFINMRHKDSLQVTDLKQVTPKGELLRQLYHKYWRSIPTPSRRKLARSIWRQREVRLIDSMKDSMSQHRAANGEQLLCR